MKKLFLLVLLICSFTLTKAQSVNPKYDQKLAESMGADQYGMKMYVLVMLKSGTNTTATKAVSDSLFMGHMANINRLANEGLLVVAGPMAANDKNYRGIFILNVKTVAEARKLIDTDPAVKEKLLDAELYGWYGSAALPTYLPNHEKVEKVKPGG